MMNQQCWCWGHDISSPYGNLLLHHGAVRVPPIVAHPSRKSAYHVKLERGGWIGLWGFGMAIAPPSGLAVLLLRFNARPLTVAEPAALRAVWAATDLPTYAAATNAAPAWWSALTAFRWVASYERWVVEQTGVSWREECAADFEESVVPGEGMVDAWSSINRRLEHAILTAVGARRPAALR